MGLCWYVGTNMGQRGQKDYYGRYAGRGTRAEYVYYMCYDYEMSGGLDCRGGRRDESKY
ncbi:hypothetical protein BDW22DRAFT_1363416 [Trametopsis cervina]|nr:hypothetical protein BDW22DRAFT_1363416 [Trametopsis cervina]